LPLAVTSPRSLCMDAFFPTDGVLNLEDVYI